MFGFSAFLHSLLRYAHNLS